MYITNYTSYVIFDLETTGLSCAKDAIIEISAIKVSNGVIVNEFSTLVNPCRHISYFASAVNGITDSMVKNAPTIETALAGFVQFIGAETLVGHNIKRFDMKFIQRDARRILGRELTNGCVDTVILAKRKLPGLKHHSLEALAKHYGISYDGAHRALADCRITYQVFERLQQEMR